MTKIVLKINCRDFNSPVLAVNFPFLEDISASRFRLIFETLPVFFV